MSQKKKPLYVQIVEYIRGKIVSGEWGEGYQLPTEVELTEIFNVSRITAKRALDDLAREGYIYRKKGHGSFVQRKKLSDDDATSLAKGKVVSIMIPYENTRSEMLDYIKGATDCLNQQGYHLAVHCIENESREKSFEYLKSISAKEILGLIYYPINITSDYQYLTPLILNKYPIVLIDKYFESLPITSVVSDNFTSVYTAMELLIKKQHKKVSFISRVPIDEASSLKDRFLGYCKALGELSFKVDHSLIINGYNKVFENEQNHDKAVEELSALVKNQIELGVTAVVVEHDSDLILAIGKLLNNGFEFPHNFTIVGFDHMEIPENFQMGLISLEQDYYQIGFTAAEKIIQYIIDKEVSNERIVLPIEINKKGLREDW